MCKSPMI